MGMTIIDAKTLKKAFLAGAQNLEAKKEWINELNVFPVPDGDTVPFCQVTKLSGFSFMHSFSFSNRKKRAIICTMK